MYAIVELGGRQWKVEPGTQLEINQMALEVGATHAVERVLLVHDGTELKVGRPYVHGAQVVCEVLGHLRGPKVISYHFRRRENWRKTVGHRQPLTRLLVKNILLSGGPTAEQREPHVAQAPSAESATASVKKRTALKSGSKAPRTRKRTSSTSGLRSDKDGA